MNFVLRITALLLLFSAPVWGQGTLFVEGDNVGIGTATPVDQLHAVSSTDPSPDGGQLFIENTSTSGSSTRTMLRLKNTGRIVLRMTDTSFNRTWNFVAGGAANEFILSENSTGFVEMGLDSGGNLEIRGTLTTGGPSCGSGCDRVFDADYEVESIEDHATAMWSNGFLPAVGPTSSDEPYNVTEKTAGMLNELEKAHIYIEQLQGQLDSLQSSLESRESEWERRVAALEAQIQATN